MTEDAKTSSPRKLNFEAEVNQLLNIVVNSLYTDKEIFVRELISNAADALEKMRRLSLTEKDYVDKEIPLETKIEADEKERYIKIVDTGVGLSESEAIKNLGTIAHSGSKEFLKQLAEGKSADTTLIGQFGVGFYSAFIVADEVIVESRSYRPGAKGIEWRSDGSGSFTVKEKDGLRRGAIVTVKLKETESEFADIERIKSLITRYSNFVPFPIYIKGEQVNKVQAIWARQKSEIKEEEYEEFYKFIHFGGDKPFYRLHFNAEAPLSIKALLFFPGENSEVLGFGRMEPGVSLYCKKVLIQQKSEVLLPEYFRFIRGVVDAEDLPLNISRETMQDSALIAKLKRVLTKRLIKRLSEEAGSDPKKYKEFFEKFGRFIKEGVYSDFDNRSDLAKLLRYDSSKMKDGELTSLDEYIERMPEKQKEIYFITGASREIIESGPYVEAFRESDIEVIYMYDGVDDLVMTSLREYEGKKIVSADAAEIDFPEEEKSELEKQKAELDVALPEKEAKDLARWIKEVLGQQINDVRVSKRLKTSPAVLVNPDDMMTTTMQRVLAATSQDYDMSRMILEVNPNHPILARMNELRTADKDNELAKEAAWMLHDNAMISAGLMSDPKTLVQRSTKILEKALGKE